MICRLEDVEGSECAEGQLIGGGMQLWTVKTILRRRWGFWARGVFYFDDFNSFKIGEATSWHSKPKDFVGIRAPKPPRIVAFVAMSEITWASDLLPQYGHHQLANVFSIQVQENHELAWPVDGSVVGRGAYSISCFKSSMIRYHFVSRFMCTETPLMPALTVEADTLFWETRSRLFLLVFCTVGGKNAPNPR